MGVRSGDVTTRYPPGYIFPTQTPITSEVTIMCSPATCHSCGKATYSGCGMHVDQVLGHVAPENRCTCR